MQKKIIVLVISVISLCYGGSLYAWGDNWGNDKTSNNMDVYNGGWSSSGGSLDSMRDMAPWNTDLIWKGGVCTTDSTVPLSLDFSWDALSEHINGLNVHYNEGDKDIYTLKSLDNHLFALTAPTNNDSVIWSYDPASWDFAYETTIPSVTVRDLDKAFVSIYSHEGAAQTAIDVKFDVNSGIEKITFRGFDDNVFTDHSVDLGEPYVAACLDVYSDPGVDLTVTISDDAKNLVIYDKHHPESSLSASIDSEMRVSINLTENGKVRNMNEEAAAESVVATVSEYKNGELVRNYTETPLTLEDSSRVRFKSNGDIAFAWDRTLHYDPLADSL
ncbi:MAG: hypothetical protein GX598_03150 [Elusimicrobia bacterium]|nr:hypothetical protein [Elusimicrobiota bacterium]